MINQCKILSSYQCFARWHDEKCTENLVKRILKINMNVIKCRKRNATTRFMIFQISGNFEKMRIFKKISKNMKFWIFEKKDKKCVGWRGTLRVLRAETWLTVYRTIAIRKQWLSRADLGPHKMINQCKILSSYQCFASMTLRKVHRNSCRAYIED